MSNFRLIAGFLSLLFLAACSDDNALNGGQSSMGATTKVSCELLDGTCLSLEESACRELVKNGKAKLLPACPSDNHSTSSSSSEGTSSIPSIPSGEGDLYVLVSSSDLTFAPYSGNGKLWLDMDECDNIEVGTVVNGKMTYTLPEPPPNCFVGGGEVFFKGVISQPTTLQIAPGEFLRDNFFAGYTSIPVYSQDRLAYSVIGLVPMYFSEAGSISGTLSGDRAETVEITAKAGWNWIAWYEQEDEQGNEVNTFKSDLSQLPSDMIWITVP
jgi:hypothetical protein